jgi:hypothetical protein
MPAPMTKSACMGIVFSNVGSAAFSSASDAPGPAFRGERIGRKAERFASSEKVLVWYRGVRPLDHGRAQICRKWTSSSDSFCSECAIPVENKLVFACQEGELGKVDIPLPPVVNWTSFLFIRKKSSPCVPSEPFLIILSRCVNSPLRM